MNVVISRLLPVFITLILATCPSLFAQTPESQRLVEKLQNLELDQLGNPQIKTDAIPPVLSTADNPHRMLIIPVQYANREFDRFRGERNADEKNRRYLEKLLFSNNFSNPQEDSLTHYYRHQSRGKFLVTGKVFPVVTVDQPSEYYGKPIQNVDGSWRNDVRPEILVADALEAALAQNPDFQWEDFDVWDPQDYDGDGIHAEADGYIDHFVLVFAGKAQSSCQGLYNLNQKFTFDASADVYDDLTAVEQECAQRIWPHRFSLTANNGKGPEVEGFMNRRGGIPLKEGLWVYDYNMQSEYTNVSTFIHEFGHSIGLPDIYARQTNNSTASWEVMSSTISPVPQEMSTWSRLVLGWMEPCIINPRSSGGSRVQSLYLKTMNAWNPRQSGENAEGLCDSAMVILPPKIRELRMGPLQENNGNQAAYTGQGNDLNHFLSRTFDLRDITDTPVLEFDTWFRIEADWDYLYIEASIDGENYQRLMPMDKDAIDDSESVMPSRKGHDGVGTIPGFTGYSGDMNGDGRVELAADCDPSRERGMAEDNIGAAEDPCENAQWVHARFDLGDYVGQEVEIRFHYYADMAAVEDGALVDNVVVEALGFRDDFEGDAFDGWKVEGFSLSSGSHDIAVPHFYLLEYRDPYETFSDSKNYDNGLAEPGFAFFPDSETGDMEAINFRYRPGVLMWYYNGSYLWSQNEPAQFGPGNGFLLLVDSTPQEYAYPSIPDQYYKDDEGWRFYEFDEDAQSVLRQGFLDVMCFQRTEDYFPVDLSLGDLAYCDNKGTVGESVFFGDRQLMYGYKRSSEYLPGEAREQFKSMSTLYDFRVRNGEITYRLYDRALRNAHSADAPFALEQFDGGIELYGIENEQLVRQDSRPFAAISTFSDADISRYLNPHLPFGSASIPSEGLNFQLAVPGENAPKGARVKVYFTWER